MPKILMSSSAFCTAFILPWMKPCNDFGLRIGILRRYSQRMYGGQENGNGKFGIHGIMSESADTFEDVEQSLDA